MSNVAWYSDRADMLDCIAEGSHNVNCDDDDYCNNCGCKDGIEDPPVQRTFGPVVGLEPLMPIAPHPEDLHRCEDTGEWKRREDCLFSYDGKAWWWSDELEGYETTALIALAEALEDGCEDCIDSDDSISKAQPDAFNNDLTWREYVADYYNNDDDIYSDFTNAELQKICDELMDRADTQVKRTGYGNFDYDLTSWDVGDSRHTIMIDNHPLLQSLNDRGKLEDMLDDNDCDHLFCRFDGRSKFVNDGSLDLMIISDKTYWWGCTHETMEEVYHEIVGIDAE